MEIFDVLNELGVIPYLLAPTAIAFVGIMPVYISGV